MLNFIMIIVEQSMIYLPLICGAYISFSLLKVPDLSLETAYLIGALSGGFVLQMTQGYSLCCSLIITVLASVIGGMLVGLSSSSLTFFGKIPHLLSSIITFGLFQGLFLLLSNSYVSLASYDNVLMLIPSFQYHPELGTLLVINLLLVSMLKYLLQTQLGYSFAIFGYNPAFFAHFKISTGYVFMTGIIIANGLAGLAGFFFAQTNSLIELNMGVGKALFCITALILGKGILYRIHTSLSVPLFGLGLYFFMQQLLLKIGFNLKYFMMIQSLVVLAILLCMYKKNHVAHDQLGV